MIRAFELSRQNWNDLFGKAAIACHKTKPKWEALLSTVTFAMKADYATMTLGSCGQIRDCEAAAAEMFGVSRVNLIGRPVFKFIAGLSHGRSSPSFGARYLEYLCAYGEWHEFEAKDMAGRAFTVELSLHRRQVSGQELFVLRLRRLEQASCS